MIDSSHCIWLIVADYCFDARVKQKHINVSTKTSHYVNFPIRSSVNRKGKVCRGFLQPKHTLSRFPVCARHTWKGINVMENDQGILLVFKSSQRGSESRQNSIGRHGQIIRHNMLFFRIFAITHLSHNSVSCIILSVISIKKTCKTFFLEWVEISWLLIIYYFYYCYYFLIIKIQRSMLHQ